MNSPEGAAAAASQLMGDPDPSGLAPDDDANMDWLVDPEEAQGVGARHALESQSEWVVALPPGSDLDGIQLPNDDHLPPFTLGSEFPVPPSMQLLAGSEAQAPSAAAIVAAPPAGSTPAAHPGARADHTMDLDDDDLAAAYEFETELQAARLPGGSEEVELPHPGHMHAAGGHQQAVRQPGRGTAAGGGHAAAAGGRASPGPGVGAAAARSDGMPSWEGEWEEVPEALLLPAPQQPPRLLACDVEGGGVLPVTAASGLRVYCAVAPDVHTAQSDDRQAALGSAALQETSRSRRRQPRAAPGLLPRPMAELMAAVQDAALEAALADSRRTANLHAAAQQLRFDAEAAPGAGDDSNPGGPRPLLLRLWLRRCRSPMVIIAVTEDGGGQEEAGAGVPAAPAPGVSALWVSKYAPRKFLNLLSDSQINRQVAQWVKAWDACVFGATAVADAKPGPAGSKPGVAGAQDMRPEKKVILLCGPPGTGKTTLAHVVAAHCGYHPYEVNASDDRSATALLNRVTDAVHMHAVLGPRKPNCVIIDEIDGVMGGTEGTGAISALLQVINATGATAGGAKWAGKGKAKGGRKRNALPPLCRPIICIANDLYAPALRPLRDVAQVFVFRPPDPDKLVARLSHICEEERVHVERAALFALAQRSDCDIRTCLNTLQFLAKQAGAGAPGQAPRFQSPRPRPRPNPPAAPAATIADGNMLSPPPDHRTPRPPPRPSGDGRGAIATPGTRRTPRPGPRVHIAQAQIQQAAIGSKDASTGLFGVWEAVLRAPRNPVRPLVTGGGAGSRGEHLSQLMSVLQDCGEYELVTAGLHENLLNIRYLDINLKNTACMLDALSDSVTLLRTAMHRGDYGLVRYVPPRLLQLHLLAAQPEKPYITWPRSSADSWRRSGAGRELLRSWAAHKVSPRVLQAHESRPLRLEVLPALLRLLAPNIRPLAPNLLTPTEHAAMRDAARALVDFGLRFDMAEPEVQAGPRGPGRPAGAGSHHVAGLLGHVEIVRPVPLDPPLDVLHVFSTGPAVTALSLARARPDAVKPVPMVLRQLLNQQAMLQGIRQADMVGDASVIGAGSEERGVLPVAQTPLKAVVSPPSRQPGRPSGAGVSVKAPMAKVDTNAATGNGKGAKGAKQVNWLDAHRAALQAKRKAQTYAVHQPSKRPAIDAGGGADALDGGSLLSPTNRPMQQAARYKHNEGYTNAVKRPLLIRELM